MTHAGLAGRLSTGGRPGGGFECSGGAVAHGNTSGARDTHPARHLDGEAPDCGPWLRPQPLRAYLRTGAQQPGASRPPPRKALPSPQPRGQVQVRARLRAPASGGAGTVYPRGTRQALRDSNGRVSLSGPLHSLLRGNLRPHESTAPRQPPRDRPHHIPSPPPGPPRRRRPPRAPRAPACARAPAATPWGTRPATGHGARHKRDLGTRPRHAIPPPPPSTSAPGRLPRSTRERVLAMANTMGALVVCMTAFLCSAAATGADREVCSPSRCPRATVNS